MGAESDSASYGGFKPYVPMYTRMRQQQQESGSGSASSSSNSPGSSPTADIMKPFAFPNPSSFPVPSRPGGARRPSPLSAPVPLRPISIRGSSPLSSPLALSFSSSDDGEEDGESLRPPPSRAASTYSTRTPSPLSRGLNLDVDDDSASGAGRGEAYGHGLTAGNRSTASLPAQTSRSKTDPTPVLGTASGAGANPPAGAASPGSGGGFSARMRSVISLSALRPSSSHSSVPAPGAVPPVPELKTRGSGSPKGIQPSLEPPAIRRPPYAHTHNSTSSFASTSSSISSATGSTSARARETQRSVDDASAGRRRPGSAGNGVGMGSDASKGWGTAATIAKRDSVSVDRRDGDGRGGASGSGERKKTASPPTSSPSRRLSTSPDPSENWMTATPSATTSAPLFTRKMAGMKAAGVIMPVSRTEWQAHHSGNGYEKRRSVVPVPNWRPSSSLPPPTKTPTQAVTPAAPPAPSRAKSMSKRLSIFRSSSSPVVPSTTSSAPAPVPPLPSPPPPLPQRSPLRLSSEEADTSRPSIPSPVSAPSSVHPFSLPAVRPMLGRKAKTDDGHGTATSRSNRVSGYGEYVPPVPSIFGHEKGSERLSVSEGVKRETPMLMELPLPDSSSLGWRGGSLGLSLSELATAAAPVISEPAPTRVDGLIGMEPDSASVRIVSSAPRPVPASSFSIPNTAPSTLPASPSVSTSLGHGSQLPIPSTSSSYESSSSVSSSGYATLLHPSSSSSIVESSQSSHEGFSAGCGSTSLEGQLSLGMGGAPQLGIVEVDEPESFEFGLPMAVSTDEITPAPTPRLPEPSTGRPNVSPAMMASPVHTEMEFGALPTVLSTSKSVTRTSVSSARSARFEVLSRRSRSETGHGSMGSMGSFEMTPGSSPRRPTTAGSQKGKQSFVVVSRKSSYGGSEESPDQTHGRRASASNPPPPLPPMPLDLPPSGSLPVSFTPAIARERSGSVEYGRDQTSRSDSLPPPFKPNPDSELSERARTSSLPSSRSAPLPFATSVPKKAHLDVEHLQRAERAVERFLVLNADGRDPFGAKGNGIVHEFGSPPLETDVEFALKTEQALDAQSHRKGMETKLKKGRSEQKRKDTRSWFGKMFASASV